MTRFDESYFDRWYRHPVHRVKSDEELARQVVLAVSAAEWALGGPVTSVLDVGCGEGNWRAPLRDLRPDVEYTGVDPSEYVVRRFGKRRNIRLGSFSDLDANSFGGTFDLVVCCGVVQFLSPEEFAKGIPALAQLTRGLMHLEIFAREDDIVGDLVGARQPEKWYRRQIQRAGLTSCGMHNYVPADVAHSLAKLEMLS